MHGDDERAGRARLGDFLDDLDVGEERAAEAAVFGRERDAEQVVFGEELFDVGRILGVRIDLGGARFDALLDELTHDVEDHRLFIGCVGTRWCDGHVIGAPAR